MTQDSERDLLELRQRAEAILEKAETHTTEISPAEVKALVQDLRVHQIELEIQNEELRLAQTELAKARDRFASLYHQAPTGYLTVNAAGIITQLNNTFAEMVRLTLDEVMGKPLASLVHPRDREVFLARFRAYFKQPAGKHLEVALVQGATGWFHARLEGRPQPSFSGVGETVERGHEALLVVVSDVSEQRKAQDALAASEQRLRALFEAGGDAVYVHDLNGRLTEVNEVTCRRLGYQRAELLAMHMGQLEPPALAEHMPERRDKLLSQGQIFYQTRHLAKDGRELPVELTCRAFQLNGQTFILSIARDISQRIRLEEERDRLQAQLLQSQKMEAVGTLAGGIAHDFNNILAAVMGFAEIGLDMARCGQDNSQEIQQVLRAAERARILVQQILTFSRKMEVELQPLDLNLAVTSQMKMIQCALPKNIYVQADLTEHLSPVKANLNQLEQVVLNLATNARDAMPQGGRLLIRTQEVDLISPPPGAPAQTPPGRMVLLSVIDDGVGMDEKLASQIFDPFFTTKEVGKGTGLGLSTVYGIVRAHGGLVVCESQPGRGSTFNVYLPALALEGCEDGRRASVAPQPAPPSTTILVIDEDPVARDMTARILEREGFQVLAAISSQEGLDLCQRRGGDIRLVIGDLGLPGRGWPSHLDQIVALSPGIKVIALGSQSQPAPIPASLAENLGGHLSKPYRRDDLLSTVRRCLSGPVNRG